MSTVLAAVVGGGVTAAVLLTVGVVDPGDEVVVVGSPDLPQGTSALAASAPRRLSAREIYDRSAAGVVFVRAQTVQDSASPFDVVDAARPSESTGSGFVLDTEGLIVTSAHLVEAATDIRVTLSDHHTVAATAVGKDADSDLALLRIEPGGFDLTPLPLGDSSAVQVGDPTIAIGNPFGLERTLATGVVAALRQRLTAASGFTIDDVMQTDAALDPGSSGGPLLDAGGRVIGINSQIATAGGGTVGFALPVNTARRLIPQLEAAGHVARAYLGIQGGATAAPAGLRVAVVQSDSPARAAGIRAGDVLETLAGRSVRGMDDVSDILAAHRPGDVVAVELRGGGMPRGLKVTLADRRAALPAR